MQEAYLAVSKAIEDLGGELGRAPTVAELAGHSGLSADDVLESFIARGGRRGVPFDPGLRGHDDHAWETVVSDHGVPVAAADDQLLVAHLMARLPEPEREVVTMSFLSGLTQGEIATRLGTSQSTVSRLLRRAIDQLRTLHGTEAAAA